MERGCPCRGNGIESIPIQQNRKGNPGHHRRKALQSCPALLTMGHKKAVEAMNTDIIITNLRKEKNWPKKAAYSGR